MFDCKENTGYMTPLEKKVFRVPDAVDKAYLRGFEAAKKKAMEIAEMGENRSKHRNGIAITYSIDLAAEIRALTPEGEENDRSRDQ